MHVLAFWSSLSREGYLAHPAYRGKGFGSNSSDMQDFVDSPWNVPPSLRKRWRAEWWEGKGMEEGR